MKISGFTVIRNAELMGYPILQSIKSILPLVDEFVVGVGQSEDRTQEILSSINDPKLKLFDSFWDKSRTKGGLILSEKTNEALDRCQNNWCFYLQADELVHEADLAPLMRTMEKYEHDSRVQGLLFDYIHFFASYNTIATSRKWYRKEVRIVKKDSGIQSHGDAQGFRVHGKRPLVVPSGGRIFHYGWVKPPEQMGLKNRMLAHWWHGPQKENSQNTFQFKKQYGLKPFTGSHPAIMKSLVQEQSWTFSHERTWRDFEWADLNLMASDSFERLFKFRIGEYKPYKILRTKHDK